MGKSSPSGAVKDCAWELDTNSVRTPLPDSGDSGTVLWVHREGTGGGAG